MKPVVLLDCDGVCFNFTSAVVAEINHLMGTHHTVEDVRQWDIYASLGVPPEIAAEVNRLIASPFFCFNLELYEGAREGVEALREFADVVAVTTPWDSPHWMREREMALVEKLGFRREDVIFTHRKDLVSGDALIDDKASTVLKWVAHNERNGVILDQPWNANDVWRACDSNLGYLPELVWHSNGWKNLVGLLKIVLPEYDEGDRSAA